MAKRRCQLLREFRQATVDEMTRLQQSEEIEDWLNEQTAPTTAYAKDLEAAVSLLEEELSTLGLSLKTH